MTVLTMAMNPTRAKDVCAPGTRTRLEERFEVRWGTESFGPEELAALLPGSDVVITSWGTPQLTAEMLSGENAPKVIAHAAGSIKNLIDSRAFDLDVKVFSAAARIAQSVGEYCLSSTLTLLRRLPQFDNTMRNGEWKPSGLRGQELSGKQVGIVGASSTARAFIALLAPFRCDVVVYDPYLTEEAARKLNVRLGSLDDVCQADIVSIHVPNLPATEGMIDRRLITAMKDGALVVNSSRGAALDYDALTKEIAKGRLLAALDVFPQEPPAPSADLLISSNVLLTPHIAGDTVEGHLALVDFILEDVIAWLDHKQLGQSYVNPSALALSA